MKKNEHIFSLFVMLLLTFSCYFKVFFSIFMIFYYYLLHNNLNSAMLQKISILKRFQNNVIYNNQQKKRIFK